MSSAATTTAVGIGEESMQAYLRAGERRSMALGNRGPIRCDEQGRIAPDELPFAYKPFAQAGLGHRWDATAKADLLDLGI